MNKKERLEKIKKETLKPNGDIRLQIALLSNLSFKLNEEKDTAKKEALRKELETLSLATNSILKAYEYLEKLSC